MQRHHTQRHTHVHMYTQTYTHAGTQTCMRHSNHEEWYEGIPRRDWGIIFCRKTVVPDHLLNPWGAIRSQSAALSEKT